MTAGPNACKHPTPPDLHAVLAAERLGAIVSVTTSYREPIATAALCDLCNFEPAVLVCCITDPLISTVKTRLCADCEPTHSRAVVRLLSRERQLVVSWAGAV